MAENRPCRIEIIRYPKLALRFLVDGELMTFGSRREESCPIDKAEALALCSRLRSAKRAKSSIFLEIARLEIDVDAAKDPKEDALITIRAAGGDWDVSLWSEEAEAFADVLEGVAKSANGLAEGAINFCS